MGSRNSDFGNIKLGNPAMFWRSDSLDDVMLATEFGWKFSIKILFYFYSRFFLNAC